MARWASKPTMLPCSLRALVQHSASSIPGQVHSNTGVGVEIMAPRFMFRWSTVGPGAVWGRIRGRSNREISISAACSVAPVPSVRASLTETRHQLDASSVPSMPPKARDHSRSPAPIACVRCRHRKKKCDHRLPSCGECEKSGADCVRFQDRKRRDAQGVPWAYIKGLETRLAHAEKGLRLCLQALRPEAGPFTTDQSGSWTSTPPQPSPDSAQTPPASSQESTPTLTEAILLRSDFDSYMLHVHPSWPFLDADRLTWLFDLSAEQQSFDADHHLLCLLHLVCAIGACCFSISDGTSCPHSIRSQALHSKAVQQYLPSALSLSQSVRTQAYLLLVIFGFHSSTPFNLQSAANEAIREITTLLASFDISSMLDSAMLDAAYPCDTTDTLATEARGDERSLLVFCYTAFEIVATLWAGSSRQPVGSLDHKVRSQPYIHVVIWC